MHKKILAAALAAAALGAVAVQPAAAAGQCSLKPPDAYTVFKQANGWTAVMPDQSGNTFSGRAYTYYGTWDRDDNPGFGGDAEGVITGRTFRITVYWDNGRAGIYEGKIDRDRFVSGLAIDRFSPQFKTTFRMTKRAVCS